MPPLVPGARRNLGGSFSSVMSMEVVAEVDDALVDGSMGLVATLLAWQPVAAGEASVSSASPPHTPCYHRLSCLCSPASLDDECVSQCSGSTTTRRGVGELRLRSLALRSQ